MKVLWSCEWIHTSFTLLSPCLSHRIYLINFNPPQKRGRCKGSISDFTHSVKHLHATTWCEFLMKQQLSWFTPATCSWIPSASAHDGAVERSASFLSLSAPLKTRCSSQRWTMMYVLHFSIGWGHRLHKCLRQVWYFNLFLVRGCWAFAQSIHRAVALPRYLMVAFHCSIWKLKCQPTLVVLEPELKYGCLLVKNIAFYHLGASDNNWT